MERRVMAAVWGPGADRNNPNAPPTTLVMLDAQVRFRFGFCFFPSATSHHHSGAVQPERGRLALDTFGFQPCRMGLWLFLQRMSNCFRPQWILHVALPPARRHVDHPRFSFCPRPPGGMREGAPSLGCAL